MYRVWWATWSMLMVSLAFFARPQILMVEHRGVWAGICAVCAVAAVSAVWDHRGTAAATVAGSTFAALRSVGFGFVSGLTFEQRVTGVASWLTYSVAVWVIGTGSAIAAAGAGARIGEGK